MKFNLLYSGLIRQFFRRCSKTSSQGQFHHPLFADECFFGQLTIGKTIQKYPTAYLLPFFHATITGI